MAMRRNVPGRGPSELLDAAKENDVDRLARLLARGASLAETNRSTHAEARTHD